nr:hypothetical protein [Tanacetum cinerariifolium]
MMTDKDSSAAGKPQGKLIWKSIQNGPTPHPQTTDPAPEGDAVPPPRNKKDEDFTEEDNRNELTDIQAINILSQGLLRRIFNILNQNETGREIWVNLELLMKGSGQTLERRKEALFDEFERFHVNGNELIQDYFVCFHKLVNDMKFTQLYIPTHQLNTKFANNLPSHWGKYVTHAKNNINMSTVTYVELFTHMRTYEEHALKSLKKKEQSSAIVDPLAYLAKTTPTHSTTLPVTVPTPQSSSDSHNDAMLATMNQIANLLSGLQKQFPPTNNQLRTSSNPNTHATVHDGQIVTETVQKRDLGNMGTKGIQTTRNSSHQPITNFGPHPIPRLMLRCMMDRLLLKRFRGELQPLMIALTTTNLFEANHEDAYDSDVHEGPHACAAFMDNLSSTGGTNGSSSSHINEALECNKVKHDLDMAIVERNKLNAELDEENVLLKSTLKSKVVSIENLQQE